MIFKLRSLILTLGILSYSSGVFSLPQKVEPKEKITSAKQIMSALKREYEKCNSYTDTGLVKTIFFRADNKRISETPFSTDFIRAKKFRFEFASKHPLPFAKLNRTIIVRSDGSVKQWQNHDLGEDKKGIHKEESLGMAIAGATGISGGSAYTIPSLLDVKGIIGWKNKLTDFHQVLRIEDGVLDGKSYYRINAVYRGKEDKNQTKTKSRIIWINKTTYLVHRIDSEHQFPDFRTETSTIYKPFVDVHIGDSRFILTNDT
jgi:hypothetical protein